MDGGSNGHEGPPRGGHKINNRQRVRAILHYQDYDRLPLVHFGFWHATMYKWSAEGHITAEEAREWDDRHETDPVASRLGFDFNWGRVFLSEYLLFPPLEEKVLVTRPDGIQEVFNNEGATVLKKPGITSISAEIDHLLKGREAWEEHYLPRLRFSVERITRSMVYTDNGALPFGEGGLEYLQRDARENPYGLHCGSLYGVIRNWVGLKQLAYLQVDDPPLFDEMIETVGGLCYDITEAVLGYGIKFDFGHFWEDICFRSGPLLNPGIFAEKAGHHYRRITDLLNRHGIDIVSVDCDGKVDELVPIWLENGVNTMFPIEVGTWGASIAPWRAQYGKALRGVGGMDKRVFARDYAAIDAEVERLRPLVDLGGYIPCPDHRIPPDAKWENVQYYCEKMRQVFG